MTAALIAIGAAATIAGVVAVAEVTRHLAGMARRRWLR